jgi:hypothetical protein
MIRTRHVLKGRGSSAATLPRALVFVPLRSAPPGTVGASCSFSSSFGGRGGVWARVESGYAPNEGPVRAMRASGSGVWSCVTLTEVEEVRGSGGGEPARRRSESPIGWVLASSEPLCSRIGTTRSCG